ncbi:ATPase [Candidatus Falkowbacteria bacterium RIFCSPHIGHO2_02_FULL_42_9]|uniref:ATPase n=1 Tax=Candidatus Falkowbacteria bacterium RIFCSPHIGHO2_02_FULL_42_9 TaxID=1797986 RepID=A0A1F5SA33_9BACT|nr:MAG: ATPase [Candidatus Falkowbacteria bacterium RIFCSPHIGHO2_02_FULL_42_9]
MIRRKIQDIIEKRLFQGKIIIIYGARQVGKTTLVKELIKKYGDELSYYSGDDFDVRDKLADKTSAQLNSFLKNKKFVVIDEAQRIKNIGLSLKLMIDNNPQIQIIATGSSSFELANKIAEPLTGRVYEYYLYPFSLEELKLLYNDLEIERLLEHFMVYGSYPDVAQSGEAAGEKIKLIAKSYSYKDMLSFQRLKNPEILEKLLQALALQIGNEVSYNELSGLVGIDKVTVASYIRILEQNFIIFRLRPFSRNLRNELKKLRKIYFYDTGLRNALINNLNPLHLRQDAGGLWENFIISERIKFNSSRGLNGNIYFWRTKRGAEIDYLEETNGELSAFEFKWNKGKAKRPKVFLEAYPGSAFETVSRENYRGFVMN